MLKFVILVSIFFNYAYAGLAPRRSGLTNEEILENLRETDIIMAEPKTFELDLDFDIEEVMRSIKKRSLPEIPEKKPREPEVQPDVIKTKITTEKTFICRGRVFC